MLGVGVRGSLSVVRLNVVGNGRRAGNDVTRISAAEVKGGV